VLDYLSERCSTQRRWSQFPCTPVSSTLSGPLRCGDRADGTRACWKRQRQTFVVSRDDDDGGTLSHLSPSLATTLQSGCLHWSPYASTGRAVRARSACRTVQHALAVPMSNSQPRLTNRSRSHCLPPGSDRHGARWMNAFPSAGTRSPLLCSSSILPMFTINWRLLRRLAGCERGIRRKCLPSKTDHPELRAHQPRGHRNLAWRDDAGGTSLVSAELCRKRSGPCLVPWCTAHATGDGDVTRQRTRVAAAMR